MIKVIAGFIKRKISVIPVPNSDGGYKPAVLTCNYCQVWVAGCKDLLLLRAFPLPTFLWIYNGPKLHFTEYKQGAIIKKSKFGKFYDFLQVFVTFPALARYTH